MQYRFGPFCAAGIVELQMMRWDTNIGSTDQEKYAHLVSVCGDPLADLTEFERVKFVMKSGQVWCNDLNSVGGR